MTEKQLRMYRAEWSKARRALRAAGFSSAEADAERKRIHASVGAVDANGAPKSSTALTNKEVSEVLAAFWAWSRAAETGLQLRQFRDDAAMGRFACREVIALINDLASRAGLPALAITGDLDAWIDGIFRRQHPGIDPDTADPDRWHKVVLAVHYRYDQVARKILGQGRNTADRHWPHQHERLVQALPYRCNSAPCSTPTYQTAADPS